MTDVVGMRYLGELSTHMQREENSDLKLLEESYHGYF